MREISLLEDVQFEIMMQTSCMASDARELAPKIVRVFVKHGWDGPEKEKGEQK